MTGVIPAGDLPDPAADVLLTRAEASDYLFGRGIRLKPATLARTWSTGADGPPCVHIRRKPFYPRRVLEAWADSQISALRTSRNGRAIPYKVP